MRTSVLLISLSQSVAARMVPRKKIIQQKIVAIDGMHSYGINPSTAAHAE